VEQTGDLPPEPENFGRLAEADGVMEPELLGRPTRNHGDSLSRAAAGLHLDVN